MWRKLADVAFWIGVSLYFGGLIAVGAIVAPAVFSTAESAHLSMSNIATPPLKMGGQVGGEIFGAILDRFSHLEVLSLILMFVGLAGWILGHKNVRRSTWVIVILWTMVGGLAALDAYWMRPKVWSLRETVRTQAAAHAAEGLDARWPERTEFDKYHTWDETLGRAKAYVLLAMILVTAWRGLADKRAGVSPDARDVIHKTLSKH